MYSAKPKVGEKDTITIESLSTWTEVAPGPKSPRSATCSGDSEQEPLGLRRSA
jgi:hypothetical protein